MGCWYNLIIGREQQLRRDDMNGFNVNQIVKGAVAGCFVILGFRVIGGENFAQLKPYNPATGKTSQGEIALPLDAIRDFN
jgi:hypothetical protein